MPVLRCLASVTIGVLLTTAGAHAQSSGIAGI